MSDKPLRVTVATLNILNDASTWQARGHLIVQELRTLAPDLIALQEGFARLSVTSGQGA